MTNQTRKNYLLIICGVLIVFYVAIVIHGYISPAETISLRGTLEYDDKGYLVFSPCDRDETYFVESNASNSHFNFYNKIEEFTELDAGEIELVAELYGILYRSDQKFDVPNVISMESGGCE